MKISRHSLKGVLEIELNPHFDKRGFFMRTYDAKIFKDYGVEREWVQSNHSRSEEKGTIRGMHFQLAPYAEAKLVRAIKGAIVDVFVDIRKGSDTFGQWGSIELSEENKKMIYIPRGFAHGFCTLTDISEIVYMVDSVYNPENERGIIWNDTTLNIVWPAENPILSKKDSGNLTFNEFVEKVGGILI